MMVSIEFDVSEGGGGMLTAPGGGANCTLTLGGALMVTPDFAACEGDDRDGTLDGDGDGGAAGVRTMEGCWAEEDDALLAFAVGVFSAGLQFFLWECHALV
jgi:hypothetical protein